ncbi:MAG TPA: glutamine-hydrolyzing GMP synthase [Firmicutes bacterium]|nr:glutamine-hydrolyzing GMP synthase [Bacillota bacterium]
MEKILVLDFGGQYNQLIARRVRECNVYSEVLSYKTDIDKIRQGGYSGIILTGGPASVFDDDAPRYDRELFELGLPVLGICYGAHLMAYMLGGSVSKAAIGEYGNVQLQIDDELSLLYKDIPSSTPCWMSHANSIAEAPAGFKVTSHTSDCKIASMENTSDKLYAVQYHPEVVHTPLGTEILRNFIYNVCGCKGDWIIASFVDEKVKELKQKVAGKKVLCALSGGVDSSVAALLMHKAAGDNLTCIFVDHGLLRKNEAEEVKAAFAGKFGINLVAVDASERFFSKLAGVTDPEQKRKIIGEEFIRVFEEEAKKIGTVDFLVQGTIYPDVIESGLGDAALIKSHHNVGGLPEHVDFKEIIEPLRDLFKDEVRKAGIELGLPHHMVARQPFPGPGLGVRIIGEVTPDKADILRDADAIFREELAKAGEDSKLSQYFAVLTNMRSVGVMGDERTYNYAVALRAVTTTDFMTADFGRIPYSVLEVVSSRIVNEVKSVNRVVYDITTKPPATIEFE